MRRIDGEIVIGRPVDVVFDYVADQSNEPQYNPRMVRAEKITAGPFGNGTQFRSAAASMGRTADMLVECTGYDRPTRLASATTMLQADISYTLTFEPAAAGKQVDQIVPRPPGSAPADMTDEQLHHAIHDVGGRLLNSLGPVLQRSFADHGAMGDPRFPHAMPTTVRGHVLMLFTQAHDSYGLSLLGLREHATASALGPIRNVAETLALTRWLLESSDEHVRQGCAYRLTMSAIDQYRAVAATLERIAPQSAQALQVAPRLVAAADQMTSSLTTMAQQDGVTIAAKPPRASRLIEQYLADSGGYMLYALLSNAGVHPGAARVYLFYGRPGTGIADFDFKGLYHVRANWIAQSISLHIDLCRLVAPVLGWQGWDAIADATQRPLRPLAEEAERRFSEPLQQAMVGAGRAGGSAGSDE